MMVAGVDPGVSGAVALLNGDERLLGMWDLRDFLGADSVARLRYELREALWADLVVVENVHAVPAFGSVPSFKLGRSLGVVLGLFAAAPTVRVSPQRWKRAMGVTADKGSSLALAREVWPGCAWFARKRDHNRAEAALLALYGIRHTPRTERGEFFVA